VVGAPSPDVVEDHVDDEAGLRVGGEAAAVPLHDSAVTRELRKRTPTRMRRTHVLAGVDGVETLRRFIGAPRWGDEMRRPIG